MVSKSLVTIRKTVLAKTARRTTSWNGRFMHCNLNNKDWKDSAESKILWVHFLQQNEKHPGIFEQGVYEKELNLQQGREKNTY